MLRRVSFVILSVAALAIYESSVGNATTPVALHEVEPVEEVAPTPVATPAETVEEWVISRFDPIMQKVGEEQGQDWRLMSAIAYSESRFIENLVSSQGAAGIMQIRPVVARHFNVPVDDIDDTETNIRLAGMLLTELADMLRIPAATPTEDRLSIILASYNAGIGHVLDARRLARAEGANPNSWGDVSRYLQ
ncbi:MAG: transglycosylase SLT domain-containing protein, partial [Alistipes sp.]|nr:transglycosylase SLT domain-containing protein [Alistipes sp.]